MGWGRVVRREAGDKMSLGQNGETLGAFMFRKRLGHLEGEYRSGAGRDRRKSEGLVGVSAGPMGQARRRKSRIWGTLFEETLLFLHARLPVRRAYWPLSPLSCSSRC